MGVCSDGVDRKMKCECTRETIIGVMVKNPFAKLYKQFWLDLGVSVKIKIIVAMSGQVFEWVQK